MRPLVSIGLLLGCVVGLFLLVYEGSAPDALVSPSIQLSAPAPDPGPELPGQQDRKAEEEARVEAAGTIDADPALVASSVDRAQTSEGNDVLAVQLLTPGGRQLNEVLQELVPPVSRGIIVLRTAVAERELGSTLTRRDYEETPLLYRNVIVESRGAAPRNLRVRSPRAPAYLCALRRERVVACEYLSPNAAEVTLVVDLLALLAEDAGLRARFIDGLGKGVAGEVSIRWEGSQALEETLSETDSEGLVQWQGLEAGPATLMGRFEGFADHVRSLELSPGQILDLGTISLQPSTSIRGRLLGEPEEIELRRLSLYRPGESQPLVSVRAGAEGEFLFQGLEPGTYFILLNKRSSKDYGPRRGSKRPSPRSASEAGIAPLQQVSTSHGDLDDVLIRLEAATEIVLNADFEPGPTIDCELRTSEGQLVSSCRLFAQAGRQHLRVAPGLYDLVWSRAGVELGTRRLQTTSAALSVELAEDE